jgi:prevent-host-death family protein
VTLGIAPTTPGDFSLPGDYIDDNVVTMSKPREMPTATVREAKAHLSRLLDLARLGQATIITSRGKAVARLVPISTQDSNVVSIQEALDAMDFAGISDPPAGAWKPSKFKPVRPKGKFSISKLVVSMRR